MSTDVPAVQPAIDLDARKVIMSKFAVDGIYSADPNIDAGTRVVGQHDMDLHVFELEIRSAWKSMM